MEAAADNDQSLIRRENEEELKSHQEPTLALKDPKEDWKKKKEGFSKLREWEEDRNYKSRMLGRALIGLLEAIIDRMVNSARENSHFVTYFKTYISVQLSTAENISKNAKKNLTPLAAPYKQHAIEYGKFIQSIGSFDDVYCQNLKKFATGLKDLVDKSLLPFTDKLDQAVTKHHKEFEKELKEYKTSDPQAEKTFVEFIQAFKQFEDYVKGSRTTRPMNDLWKLENNFLRFAYQSNEQLKKFRQMLDVIWTEAKELEKERIKVIKQLYQDIVEHNQAIFGENKKNIDVIKELSGLNHLQVVDELYSFRAVVSQGELEALMKLSKHIKSQTDFENISELRLKDFFNSVDLETKAPESRLVLKKSLLKRDGGKFSGMKESTAVLSMDMMLYVFDWNLLKRNQLNEPKLTLNAANLTNVEVKKDYQFVLTEKKSGIFSSSSKVLLQAHSLEDLEEWVQLLRPVK